MEPNEANEEILDDDGKGAEILTDMSGKMDADGNLPDDEMLPVEEPEDSKKGDEEDEKALLYEKEIAKVKKELEEERSRSREPEPAIIPDKKTYTKHELRNYRRLVEQKYEDREITLAEKMAYIDEIDELNEARLREELDRESTKKMSRTRAEQNIMIWAKEHAPDILDKRTKASRDAMAFAETELGAVLENGSWIIPENVGRAMFHLASAQDGKEQDAERRGREKVLKEKEARDRDLKAGDRPPGGPPQKSTKKAEVSAAALEVKERLDLNANEMKAYLRMRGKQGMEVE